jgi:hypothetical protein
MPRALNRTAQERSWTPQAARLAKHREPASHAKKRPSDRGRDAREPAAAVRLPHHDRRQDDRDERGERRQAVDEELRRPGSEQVGRCDDDAAEDHQGDDVQHRLGDDGAEEHGERVPHAPSPTGEHHRAGWLAEAGWQGGRHEDADHRGRGDVTAANLASGERGAGDRKPGHGPQEHRPHHQSERDHHPGEIRPNDARDHVLKADLVGGQRRQPEAEETGDAEAEPPGDAMSERSLHWQGLE